MTPLVVVGLPTYNQAAHLPEALETLLGQRLQDFAIVVCDDRSTDETVEVARGYAERDPRIRVEVNERRLGLVGNWMRTLELARRRFPDARYFLPASDHDAWHPRFLSELVDALEGDPGAVLAYPRNVRVGDGGEVLRLEWPDREYTAPLPSTRVSDASRTMVAGDMVYGLIRLDALDGMRFRRVLLPDRLLIAELAMKGSLVQVPRTLWRRRYEHVVTADRQRDAIFPDGAPRWSRLPWVFPHLTLLAADAALGRGALKGRPAGERARLWTVYAGRTGAILARGQANFLVNRVMHHGARSVAAAPRPVRVAVDVTYAGLKRSRQLVSRST
ncbi:glycosyltransferase family 2 protein [Solirubrobacter soli]|uniref:glycosyltransferase family 2 protein n=1 Tax=Solirubrobacter soli TaxID=363832 RepID=UPI000427FB32|nr:glycosyltransferase family 2 protein [Solirubrobacter soli]